MKKLLLLTVTLLLVACGGGGGSSSTSSTVQDTTVRTDQRNLAASENGATVTSTYDPDSANFVIDGDTSESFFWSGNITGDSLTIDFGQVSHISTIQIYNTELFLGGSDIWIVEISEDQVTWTRTVVFGSGFPGAEQCREFGIDTQSGSIICVFDSERNRSIGPDARYLRLTITNPVPSEVLDIRIFEIIVDGR